MVIQQKKNPMKIDQSVTFFVVVPFIFEKESN